MNTIPIPKPRAVTHDKRPIPLPRTIVPKHDELEEIEQELPKTIDMPQNTLTRRISNTSKQIVEEISSVLDQTRLSLKKKHKKSIEEHPEIVVKQLAESPDIFNTISFKSPLTIVRSVSETSSWVEENEIYQSLNKVNEIVSDDECDSLPPPQHPPPPLPDMSMYDTPQKNKDVTVQSSPIPVKKPPRLPALPNRSKQPSLPYIPPPPEDEPLSTLLPSKIMAQSPKIQSVISKTPPISPRRISPSPDKPTPNRANAATEERITYEAIFPVYPVFSQTTDSESSGTDSRSGTLDHNDVTRPESWNFYDPVTLNDSTYMNVASYKRKNRYIYLLYSISFLPLILKGRNEVSNIWDILLDLLTD